MADIVERLRGKYTVPVDDGGGPLNGSNTFTREFDVPLIQKEAADEIHRLRAALNTARIMDNYKSARSAALSQIWALMGVADHESALSRLAKLEAVAEAARLLVNAHEHPATTDKRGVLTFVPEALDKTRHALAALEGEKADG